MNKISLIVPCYNEEANILPFYNAISKIFMEGGGYKRCRL